MEMLAEFLLLGWDGNPIKKKTTTQKSQRVGWKDGHPYKWRPASSLGDLDLKQEINTQDTSFPSGLLHIPVRVNTEGGKIGECSVQKLEPRQGARSRQGGQGRILEIPRQRPSLQGVSWKD